jgi:methylenetetrahydrofolate--tRNA-(uracil-5-)-methyltransferase
MIGALYRYLRDADPRYFQPMNANFGLVDDLAPPVKDKRVKRERLAARALADLRAWQDESERLTSTPPNDDEPLVQDHASAR